jgi:transcription elongation factor Elf1
MLSPIEASCKECGRKRVLNQVISIKHYQEGGPIYCESCSWQFHLKAENAHYSNLYRCINPQCLAQNSVFHITDSDEDFVVLACQWCVQEFRVSIPYDDDPYPLDDAPTPEQEQQMIDDYHYHKYGEC